MPKTLTQMDEKATAERQRALAFESAKSALVTAEAAVPRLEARAKTLDAQAKLLASMGESAVEIPADLEVMGRATMSGFPTHPGGNVRYLVGSLIAAGAEVLARQRADASARLKTARTTLTDARKRLAEFEDE